MALRSVSWDSVVMSPVNQVLIIKLSANMKEKVVKPGPLVSNRGIFKLVEWEIQVFISSVACSGLA